MSAKPNPEVLTPAEVAAMFGVGVSQVAVWARAGLIPFFRTPGGERRYYAADVERLLQQRAGAVVAR